MAWIGCCGGPLHPKTATPVKDSKRAALQKEKLHYTMAASSHEHPVCKPVKEKENADKASAREFRKASEREL